MTWDSSTEPPASSLQMTDSRRSKGLALYSNGRVYPQQFRATNARTFEVDSDTRPDTHYEVVWSGRAGVSSCTCMDFTHRGESCKHIYAVDIWNNNESV